MCQAQECTFLRTPKFKSELGFVEHDSRLVSVQDLVTGNLTMVAVLTADLRKKQVNKETLNTRDVFNKWANLSRLFITCHKTHASGSAIECLCAPHSREIIPLWEKKYASNDSAETLFASDVSKKCRESMKAKLLSRKMVAPTIWPWRGRGTPFARTLSSRGRGIWPCEYCSRR